MFIVEVVETAQVLYEGCISDDYYQGLVLSNKESVEIKSRRVVGIFKDIENAEKCRRLQPEFDEDWPDGWCGSVVVIREIDSDF